MLMAGVSIGQQAHHDPPQAGEKHSYSLNRNVKAFVFQSFFSWERSLQSYVFSVQSLDRLKTVEEYKQK